MRLSKRNLLIGLGAGLLGLTGLIYSTSQNKNSPTSLEKNQTTAYSYNALLNTKNPILKESNVIPERTPLNQENLEDNLEEEYAINISNELSQKIDDAFQASLNGQDISVFCGTILRLLENEEIAKEFNDVFKEKKGYSGINSNTYILENEDGEKYEFNFSKQGVIEYEGTKDWLFEDWMKAESEGLKLKRISEFEEYDFSLYSKKNQLDEATLESEVFDFNMTSLFIKKDDKGNLKIEAYPQIDDSEMESDKEEKSKDLFSRGYYDYLNRKNIMYSSHYEINKNHVEGYSWIEPLYLKIKIEGDRTTNFTMLDTQEEIKEKEKIFSQDPKIPIGYNYQNISNLEKTLFDY